MCFDVQTNKMKIKIITLEIFTKNALSLKSTK